MINTVLQREVLFPYDALNIADRVSAGVNYTSVTGDSDNLMTFQSVCPFHFNDVKSMCMSFYTFEDGVMPKSDLNNSLNKEVCWLKWDVVLRSFRIKIQK